MDPEISIVVKTPLPPSSNILPPPLLPPPPLLSLPLLPPPLPPPPPPTPPPPPPPPPGMCSGTSGPALPAKGTTTSSTATPWTRRSLSPSGCRSGTGRCWTRPSPRGSSTTTRSAGLTATGQLFNQELALRTLILYLFISLFIIYSDGWMDGCFIHPLWVRVSNSGIQ